MTGLLAGMRLVRSGATRVVGSSAALLLVLISAVVAVLANAVKWRSGGRFGP